MLYFRSCPKCLTGTIQLDSDFYGSYISCLNCGFEKSAASVRKINFDQMRAEAEAEAAMAEERKVPVAAGVDEFDEGNDLDDDYYDEDDEDAVELERAAG